MTRAFLIRTIVIGLAIGLTACGDDAAQTGHANAASPPPAAASPSAAPAGPVATVPAIANDDLQEAASVSQLQTLPQLDAKIFSVSGGDPALNGLITYLGLYTGPNDGWRLYPIGDFNSWRVSGSGPGRVVLAIRQDRTDADGKVQTSTGHVHIGFAGTADAAPDKISVAFSD